MNTNNVATEADFMQIAGGDSQSVECPIKKTRKCRTVFSERRL